MISANPTAASAAATAIEKITNMIPERSLIRRNAILVLIGIELMLNAANLNFIAFWRYGPNPEALTGIIFVIFSIASCRGGSGRRLGIDHRHLSPFPRRPMWSSWI